MNNGEITSTPGTRYLLEMGIPYRFFKHIGEVHSLEQAARERGQKVDQIIRSIVFRLSRGGYVMVLVAGERQVSWHVLRRFLGISQISMATEAEVLNITGYPLGAVSPFGTQQPLRILVDRSALQQDEISIGSGLRHATVIMLRQDFMRALGEVEVGDFSEQVGPLES